MSVKSKANGAFADKGSRLSAALSPELRRWITQVIVPILVEQFLQQKSLQPEEKDG
jgi:hypothetical protein